MLSGVPLPFCWPPCAYHVGSASGCLPQAGLTLQRDNKLLQGLDIRMKGSVWQYSASL